MVSEALAEVPDEALKAVGRELGRGLEEWFGATTTAFRLDAGRPVIDW